MSGKCVRIPTDTPWQGLEPTDYIPPEGLESGEPKEEGKSCYGDQTGQLDAGVWQCQPNRHRIDGAPYDEFVYLLDGEIEVIADDGSSETYRAGDSFMMPRGCTCTWDVKSPVKKLYVVLTASGYVT